jgi:hypothetical protein
MVGLVGNLTAAEIAAFEEMFVPRATGFGAHEQTGGWIQREGLKSRMLELSYRYRDRAEYLAANDLRAALDGQGWLKRKWTVGRAVETCWNFLTYSLV